MIERIRTTAKAVIIEAGRLLVIKKRAGERIYYTLPGGKQQTGESLTDALRRECREEIAVEVQVGGLLCLRDYIGANHEFAAQDADMHKVEFFFEGAIDDLTAVRPGSAPDGRQIGIEWLPVADLPDLPLYPRALGRRIADGSMGERPIYLGDVN
ncbi:MAG: NUDIX domain-containing protein [Candidatus Brocadiia bacterium]